MTVKGLTYGTPEYREAKASYMRHYRVKRQQLGHLRGRRKAVTHGKYEYEWGCRCPICRDAHSVRRNRDRPPKAILGRPKALREPRTWRCATCGKPCTVTARCDHPQPWESV